MIGTFWARRWRGGWDGPGWTVVWARARGQSLKIVYRGIIGGVLQRPGFDPGWYRARTERSAVGRVSRTGTHTVNWLMALAGESDTALDT